MKAALGLWLLAFSQTPKTKTKTTGPFKGQKQQIDAIQGQFDAIGDRFST